MTRKIFSYTALAVGLLAGPAAALAAVIPTGTRIDVRVDQTIDARDHIDGRVFTGSVAQDVIGSEGRVTVPRGAPVEIVIRRVDRNELAIDFDSVMIGGKRYGVDATNLQRGGSRQGVGENRRTGEFVGGGALLGTLLGAIAGGGKGAAIGALAGGAAGAGAQTITRGNALHIPAEAILSFRLENPLNVYPDPGYDRDGRHFHRFDDQNNPYGDKNYYDDGTPRYDRRPRQ